MSTNSALVVPSSTGSNAPAEIAFQEAVKPPLDIADPWFWLWLSLIAVVLGVSGYFLWRYFQRKAKQVPLAPAIPPHDRARRALERALGLISDPKAFTTAVSDAVRTYLEERFNFHAPDRTTEEFLHELQGTSLLSDAQKESLAGFLSSCDLIKFAKYEPTETELRAMHGSAMRLVNETEPRVIALDIGSSAASLPAPVATANSDMQPANQAPIPEVAKEKSSAVK